MYDYSKLPTLVLNQIFGYLSVKERIKAKSVCRSWRDEIKLREKRRNTLVLHVGPYLWNLRWSQTNNRGLAKFENSFEMKRLAFLKHPRTRSLLEKTKKLVLVKHYLGAFPDPDMKISTVHIGYFKKCEEIEIRNFDLQEKLIFDLPKLKTLVINDCVVDTLVLNCPSLEVLFFNTQLSEIDFQNAKKLRRFIGCGWPKKVSFVGKLEALEYLNLKLSTGGRCNGRVSDLPLNRMPKLKQLVLFSSNPQADLEIIRGQQKRFGLSNLEVLFSGFRGPVEVQLYKERLTGLQMVNLCADPLFENYSKLVDDSPWAVYINYSKLFSKFKILPSNFVKRFSTPRLIEIAEVTDYMHLFDFLKCYPFIQRLKIHFSKVDANRVLDKVHSLQPSLRELEIVEERPSELIDIDLSFLRLFHMVFLTLESNHVPVKFLRELAANSGSELTLHFVQIKTDHKIAIFFLSQSCILRDLSCGTRFIRFSSAEKLISHMQSDPHLSTILFV